MARDVTGEIRKRQLAEAQENGRDLSADRLSGIDQLLHRAGLPASLLAWLQADKPEAKFFGEVVPGENLPTGEGPRISRGAGDLP